MPAKQGGGRVVGGFFHLMAEELSYVIVTPHSMRKSRTGGIVSRLISRTGLDLVRARMFAPGEALVERYAAQIVTDPDPRHRATQGLIRNYMLRNFRESFGIRPRVLFLVLRGEEAVRKVHKVVGHIAHGRTMGETIRDTYGDYVTDAEGRCVYFEPAVLAPPDPESAERDLRLWADFSDCDGGILYDATGLAGKPGVENTLVLIKPDNFRFPNARPGGVIDVFSRSGLPIVGIKVHRMSVAEAEQFYGPVLAVLQDSMRNGAGIQARMAIERELGVALTDEIQHQLGDLIGPVKGRDHWETIVKFMSGLRPGECPENRREDPGTEKCIAIVYQGPNAVRKIRELLGPTDPSKAPPGSIRREFGQSMMINAAHASDSPENALREMQIIKMEENNFKELIELYHGAQPV
jgi:nucleoside diphosphate kinase